MEKVSNNRLNKIEKVKEIEEKFQKATSIVFVDYKGINVEQDTLLRKRMRDLGIDYKVYKNRLLKIVSKKLGYDFLDEHLEGSTSVAFGYGDDVVSSAKIIDEFSEKLGKVSLKVAIIENEFYDNEKVHKLAKIPSREVLISKLLGSLKSSFSNFVYVLNAIKNEKEKES